MALPSKYEDGLSDLDYQAALTAQEPEEDIEDYIKSLQSFAAGVDDLVRKVSGGEAEEDFADLDEDDEDEDEAACEKDYADDEEEDPA